MTAIVGVFSVKNLEPREAARAALAAMHARGSEQVELWHDGDVALGAVSDVWETGTGPGAARLAADEAATVVTDASLYYVSDLRAALGRSGIAPAAASPAALILASYRAWGEAFLDKIEGDFALIVWDRRTRTVLAARDHAGYRPLFYAAQAGGMAIASRLDGLTALPSFDQTLNLVSVADDALYLRVQNPAATAYSAASRLPAGHRLTWSLGHSPRIERWWEVPVFLRDDGVPFAEGKEELRRLIVAAVAEREAHPAGSAIWLSGGYDSSTLFAASRIAAREAGTAGSRTVSMSFPPGDPGREDEIIEMSTGFWQTSTTWLDVDAVPPLTAPVEAARLRDEPFYHPYEQSNRALAVATRGLGARVALVGNGGDQFFSVTVIRLADHLLGLHWIKLAKEWREAGGGTDWRAFVRIVLLPNFPPEAISVANRLLRRRTLQHRLQRQLPPWTNRAFDQLPVLEDLNRRGLERRRGEGHAALEQSWFLRHVTGERFNAAYTATGLLDGIEIRTPLFDSRIVRFAAGRPISESYSQRENKRLLRGAFEGYLPASVLGPRATRTGLPMRALFRMTREHAMWVSSHCQKGMILADLRVTDGSKFLERARHWATQRSGDGEEAAALNATAQVECWLRARLGVLTQQ
jgi:asparagine synthase (glutamine-hydrolysing)